MRAVIVAVTLLVLAHSGRVEAQIPKKQDIPKNLSLLKTSRRAEDRAYAAQQLGLRGQVRSSDVQEAVEPLVAAVKSDSSASVRKAAATALGQIALEPDKVVPALTDALKDKSVEVRMAAASAVAAFGADASSALPALREMAADKKKKKESQVARQAIQSITGKNKK
jgi:HEAT repeat protein